MPDGTVIEGVPVGTPKEEILRRWQGKANDNSEKTANSAGWGDAIGAAIGANPFLMGGPAMGDTLSGMWEGAKDLSRGAQQTIARPLRVLGVPQYADALDAEQARADARNKGASTAHKAGEFTTNVLASIPGAGMRGALTAGAFLGAAEPSKSAEGQAANIGTSMAISGAAQKSADLLAGWLTKPGKDYLRGADAQARDDAIERGFNLRPGQKTGSPWKRGIESFFRTAPTTAGKEADTDLANQLLLEARVRDVAPPMSQVDAGAAAVDGWKSGLAKESERIDEGYRDVLRGQTIPLEPARKPLEAVRAGAERLPDDLKGGKARESLDILLGTGGERILRKPQAAKPVDSSTDDIVTAIRKYGGIDPSDPHIGANVAKGLRFNPDPRLGPVWAKQTYGGASNRTFTARGHSLESITQKLHRDGYVSGPAELDEVLDKLADSVDAPGAHFSAFRDHGAAQAADDPFNRLTAAVEKLDATLSAKGQKQPKPGFIADAGSVSGDTAQQMRSNYGTKAFEATPNSQEAKIYTAMRGAIDEAIEKALPLDKRGQFDAVNKRYGIYAALERMTPENQATFVKSLYAGAESNPDRFYTFLGMAPAGDFAKVARGFLSDIVEQSTNKGTLSGATLGRLTDKADKEAAKYLGGQQFAELWRLGRIGSRTLPDAAANTSRTAQHVLMQNLVTGGMGGGIGALSSGDGGALGGAALGAGSALLGPKVAQSLYYGAHADKRALAESIRRMGPVWARALGLQQ